LRQNQLEQLMVGEAAVWIAMKLPVAMPVAPTKRPLPPVMRHEIEPLLQPSSVVVTRPGIAVSTSTWLVVLRCSGFAHAFGQAAQDARASDLVAQALADAVHHRDVQCAGLLPARATRSAALAVDGLARRAGHGVSVVPAPLKRSGMAGAVFRPLSDTAMPSEVYCAWRASTDHPARR